MIRFATACRRGDPFSAHRIAAGVGGLMLPILLSSLLLGGPARGAELPPSEPPQSEPTKSEPTKSEPTKSEPRPAISAARATAPSVRSDTPATVPLRPPRRSALTRGGEAAAPAKAVALSGIGRSGPAPRGSRGPQKEQVPVSQAAPVVQQKVTAVEPLAAEAPPAPTPAPTPAPPPAPPGGDGGVTIALPDESEMQVVSLLPPDSMPRATPMRPLRRARLQSPLELEPAAVAESAVALPSILDGLADAAVAPAEVPDAAAVQEPPTVTVQELPPAAESIADPPPPDPALHTAGAGGMLREPSAVEPAERAGAPEDQARDRIGVEVEELPALAVLESAEPSRLQTARRPPAGEAVPERAEPPAETGTLSIRDILRERMDGDTVIARVNGAEIHWSAIVESSASLPVEFTQRIESVFPALLQRMIDVTLLAQAGRELNLQDDPAIKRRVQTYEDNLIRQAMVDRMLDGVVNDETLARAYEEEIARAESGLKVQARHIVVSSEASGREIIRALDGGADFALLARERSMGPSARRGGDLGTFQLDRMPPAFAAAVRPLQAGAYTREPVQTEFGWHVVLLEQRYDKRLPSFEETKAQLRRALARQAIDGLLEQLRSQASIELMPEAEDQPGSDSAGGASDDAVLGKIR